MRNALSPNVLLSPTKIQKKGGSVRPLSVQYPGIKSFSSAPASPPVPPPTARSLSIEAQQTNPALLESGPVEPVAAPTATIVIENGNVGSIVTDGADFVPGASSVETLATPTAADAPAVDETHAELAAPSFATARPRRPAAGFADLFGSPSTAAAMAVLARADAAGLRAKPNAAQPRHQQRQSTEGSGGAAAGATGSGVGGPADQVAALEDEVARLHKALANAQEERQLYQAMYADTMDAQVRGRRQRVACACIRRLLAGCFAPTVDAEGPHSLAALHSSCSRVTRQPSDAPTLTHDRCRLHCIHMRTHPFARTHVPILVHLHCRRPPS